MRAAGLRRLGKQALASLLRLTGATALGRRRHAGQVLILTYHGVLEAGRECHAYLSRNFVDQDVFAAQMAHLASHYTCVSLSEVVHRLATGRPLPDRAAVVTFDDGFRNNYTRAFPVLKSAGVPATVFLTTGHIGRGSLMLWTERVAWLLAAASPDLRDVPLAGVPFPVRLDSQEAREQSTRALLRCLKRASVEERDVTLSWLEAQLPASDARTPDEERYAFLDWDEVRSMSAGGLVEFGSHTVTHLLLSGGSRAERDVEIAQSRLAIEEATGKPCTLFAFPNGKPGDFDDGDKRSLAALGYRCAVTQVAGFNGPAADLFGLCRFNVSRGHTLPVFEALTAGVWPGGDAA